MRLLNKHGMLLLVAGFLVVALLSFAAPLLKYAVESRVFDSTCVELRDPGKRVLVIAPHPDDETLAAAGIIQRALMDGDSVKVVVVTSGNHFVKAAQVVTGKKVVGPADFAYLGKVREKECLNALKELGVNKRDIIFLRYADRGVLVLWRRSHQRTRVCDAQAQRLAVCFKNILTSYRPTDVYYPSGVDEHPDHKGVNDFVDNVLNSSQIKVRRHLYLIHYDKNIWPYFPRLYRYLPLIPPYELIKKGMVWEVFSLRPDEVERKELAVRRYRSQLEATGGRYLIFVRSKEIFLVPDR